ncbi:MAG: hypothetical protein M9894_14415 [Planctomycetes bacterium]|nr:hypothetical protein [Planctomycetota bacterium]
MPDDRLRELERTFRRTGAPADMTSWLRERARARSGVDLARLRAAAALGHEVARQTLDPEPAPTDVVAALEASGPDAVVRALVAIARRDDPPWARPSRRDAKKGRAAAALREALQAAEDWLAAPSRTSEARAARAAAVAIPTRERFTIRGSGGSAAQHAAAVAGGQGLTYVPPPPEEEHGPRITSGLIEATRAMALERHLAGPRSRLADVVEAERLEWADVRAPLTAWLLGLGGPDQPPPS